MDYSTIRRQLLDYAFDITQDVFYKDLFLNITKLRYPKRYHDWYHGYTELKYPYHDGDVFNYFVSTYSASGNISTKYFGEKFNLANVDARMYISSVVN